MPEREGGGGVNGYLMLDSGSQSLHCTVLRQAKTHHSHSASLNSGVSMGASEL